MKIDSGIEATYVPTGPAEVPEEAKTSSVGDSSGSQIQSSDEKRRQAETMCADDTANKVQVKGGQSSDPQSSDEGDSLVIFSNYDVEPEYGFKESPRVQSSLPHTITPRYDDIPRELSLLAPGGRLPRQVYFNDILAYFKLSRDEESSTFGGDQENVPYLATAKRQFEKSYPAAGIAGKLSQTGSARVSDDIKFLKKLKNLNKHGAVEVWNKLQMFIKAIFGDSVYTGWGSGFQELDEALQQVKSNPSTGSNSIPSNSLEFLDATIDFLIELLKDRQAILEKSERSTRRTFLATFVAGVAAATFSRSEHEQPNQVQVAETPSGEPDSRTQQISLSRSENTQLLTLDDIKNISSEDDLMALNGRAILLGELTDYEFAKTLKDKPGWKEFEGKPGIIQGVIGDDVDFSDPKNVYAAVISGAANLKSLQDHIKKETKPITPKTLFIFTNRPSDRNRPVRIPSIPKANCYPIVTKQVNSAGSIFFNFHIQEINERARFTKEKQRIVLEPVVNPYSSQENFI